MNKIAIRTITGFCLFLGITSGVAAQARDLNKFLKDPYDQCTAKNGFTNAILQKGCLAEKNRISANYSTAVKSAVSKISVLSAEKDQLVEELAKLKASSEELKTQVDNLMIEKTQLLGVSQLFKSEFDRLSLTAHQLAANTMKFKLDPVDAKIYELSDAFYIYEGKTTTNSPIKFPIRKDSTLPQQKACFDLLKTSATEGRQVEINIDLKVSVVNGFPMVDYSKSSIRSCVAYQDSIGANLFPSVSGITQLNDHRIEIFGKPSASESYIRLQLRDDTEGWAKCLPVVQHAVDTGAGVRISHAASVYKNPYGLDFYTRDTVECELVNS